MIDRQEKLKVKIEYKAKREKARFTYEKTMKTEKEALVKKKKINRMIDKNKLNNHYTNYN